MKSSIYIGAGQISVIGYAKQGKTVKIFNYVSSLISEETTINGKITDPTELAEKLLSLKAIRPQLFKETSLVVDGNAFVTKKISVPNLKKSQYYQLVKEDLGETAENYENLIFDYSFMGTKGGKDTAILACGTDKSTLENYISVFNEVGVKLTSISVGLETILNFVKKRPDLANKTFVLNIVDGVSMLSVIFENGKYVFSTRTRLMGEAGEQFLINVYENLSPLIQFNKSQQFSDVQASYYLGLEHSDVDFISKLNTNTLVDIGTFDLYRDANGTALITDPCHFAFLGIVNEGAGINLANSFKNIDKYKAERKRLNPWWILPIAAVMAILASLGYPIVKTIGLSNTNNEITAYLTSPEVVAKSTELDLLSSQITKINEILRQIEEKKVEIADKPRVVNTLLDTITKSYSEKVAIKSFSFDEKTGVVHVVGTCATQTDSAEYIDILKKNSMITSVVYTGYSYDNTEEKRFNFEIDIVLEGTKVEVNS